MKNYICVICGEENPENFYTRNKSRCKICICKCIKDFKQGKAEKDYTIDLSNIWIHFEPGTRKRMKIFMNEIISDLNRLKFK